jgi:Phage integrase family
VQNIGQRLAAELEMRRYRPDQKEHGADKFVFGNEVGEQIASIKTAWRATCRRAGIVNLHVHDLRREFGSRLLESGASQHDVRDFLGHSNITTTSRYLKSSIDRLEKALAAMEGPVICPSFAQSEVAQLVEHTTDETQNLLKGDDLEMVARDRIELSTLRFSDRPRKKRKA